MKRKPKVGAKVLLLPVDSIAPSPYQARQNFAQHELAGLALSIAQNGLLQPISVRKLQTGYQLVAGERRLRACKLAGLQEIPAILCSFAEAQTAALGLLENIQRQNLDPFEQAQGIKELLALWDCTQKQAAQRLGMTQPTLNNKLRLLALTPAQQQYCLQNGLGERHARAVLRLEQEQERSYALRQFAAQGMSAKQADDYIERRLNLPPKKRRGGVMVRDIRIFANTINHAVRLMVDAGIPASSKRVEGEGFVEYTVRIPVATPQAQPEQKEAAKQLCTAAP